jgi:tetratricopeptide (TPR) repeat protein
MNTASIVKTPFLASLIVTTPSEPDDHGQLPPEEITPSSESPVPDANPPVPGPSAENEQPQVPQNPDEGLPEWEPLTPELVEDEAIRGDFVIRWAVVGLALLFGFAPIADTRTLVHVRSGEYLASHGFLPPGLDPFSYTANDRAWINLSWMFDLIAAGIHGVSGGIGLTIVQGVLAGVAFGLLAHTYSTGIRTWWGSICAALALLACYPQFTSQPELITLVGLALVLWISHRSSESGNSRMLWSCVPVVWLWAQLDPRAFLGWLLLMCLAAGESLRRREDSGLGHGSWWQVACASLAVTVIHPFHWNAWASPVRLFAVDYPALQQTFTRPGSVEMGFYPMTYQAFWDTINHDSIAALVLFAATVVSLVLNRERLHPGHLIAVVVFNVLGGLATHELAAVSLVNCVVCTINAQSWYRHRFGQVYSVDWRELLFSRGGRAVTVLTYFGLAWLVISGRIDGPQGRRTALGFDEILQVQMDSYQQIAPDNLDDRPFHFVARQGDLLIWSGQKSFIDTRASLFSGSGESDLIALHDRTRRALQKKRSIQAGSGEPEIWKATFEKYQITHALPRLSGPIPGPDYYTFSDLLSSSDWVLTRLTPSTSVFYRNVEGTQAAEYAATNQFDFVRKAFQTEDALPETARVCARPPTMADGLFSARHPRYPGPIQQAGHYLQLATPRGETSPRIRVACALLAIRESTAGLREDSNSADGYYTLARAYLVLDDVETSLMREAGLRWFNTVRYYQTVAALHQAALLRPTDQRIQSDLLGMFERTQRGELALEAIRHFKRIRPVTAETTEDERKQREQLLNVEISLEEVLAKIETQVEQQLADGADRFQVAAGAYQAGAVRVAIRTLEDDPIYTQQNPIARGTLGSWLIEAGRVQDGLDAMEQVARTGGVPGWRDSVAGTLLINGEYQRAIDLWRDQANESISNSTQATLLTLPFLTLNSVWMSPDQYPFTQMAAAGEVVGNVRLEVASLMYHMGQAQLELGDVAGARKTFESVFPKARNTQLQPLIKFYLEALTGSPIEIPTAESPELEEFEPMGEASSPKDKPKPGTGEKVLPTGEKVLPKSPD